MTIIERLQRTLDESEACRLGRHEYDMARYCYEHGGFVAYMQARPICDRHPVNDDPSWKNYA